MNIEYVDANNYDKVVEFLKEENQNINDWTSLLKDGLFKICALNANTKIECVFIFEDYPYSQVNNDKYEFITKSNWCNWLKQHFEVPSETYHTLWLTKWCTTKSRKFDADLLKLVLCSLFISNFEIESILVAADSLKADKNHDKNQNEDGFNVAFQMLFHPLHRIHRTNNQENINDNSLKDELDLFYCPSSKILPTIDIRKATVEDFDDLMPLFQKESAYLQQRHGEFFLAELIEAAQRDKRMQTLVAIADNKPVGFVSFTTNVDIISLKNSFYLEQFDYFQNHHQIIKIDPDPKESEKFKEEINTTYYNKQEIISLTENNANFAEIIAGHIMKFYSEKEWNLAQEELLKQSPENDGEYIEFIKKGFEMLDEKRCNELEKYLNDGKMIEYIKERPSKLTIDTLSSPISSSPISQDINQESSVIVINLLCIDESYVYAMKIFAQCIFNYYQNCEYLLATTDHDQPTPNYLSYFSRVYPKPSVEYPHDLYLVDKNALNATLSIRKIDWKTDIEPLKEFINSSIPNRKMFLMESNDIKGFVVIVDYKIVGVVYLCNITKEEISSFSALYDLSVIGNQHIEHLNTNDTAKLEWMTINPIFYINVRGILKEIMRKTDIDTLFYNYTPQYNDNNKIMPDPQSCIIENFWQIKPRQFVYSSLSSNKYNQITSGLYIFCRQFYSENREIINHRIVIIGNNDDASYGLIQNFITQKDLKFSNLTLINGEINKFTQNINDYKTNTLLYKSNIVSDTINNGDYLQKLCIDHKLNIVNDTISKLEIENKHIYLSESGVLQFDILVFANGLSPVYILPKIKYYIPDDKKLLKKQNPTNEQLFQQVKKYQNILLTSPQIEQDIINLEIYLQENNVANIDKNIVIYGDELNNYCIINQLISKHNINGNKIILVKCLSSTSNKFYFKNNTLKMMIQKQLKDLGVKILENVIPVGFIKNKINQYLIHSIQFIQNENQEINAMIINDDDDDDDDDNDDDDDDIIKLIFHNDSLSGLPYYSLQCQLCILCQNEISFDTLSITNQDPFVIDGEIVTNNQFKTQNPSIYACGSICKISRQYQNNYNISSFKYTNSFDIGQQCAKIITDNILEIENNDKLNINLEKETSVIAQLFNGYFYFYAYNPQFALNHINDKDQRFQNYDGKQFNMISFDKFGYLTEILYYGIEWKSEWIKCANLINTHSAFLNSIQSQFNNDNNINICKILNENKYYIMCDDRFKSFIKEIEQNDNKMDKIQIKTKIESLINRIANN